MKKRLSLKHVGKKGFERPTRRAPPNDSHIVTCDISHRLLIVLESITTYLA